MAQYYEAGQSGKQVPPVEGFEKQHFILSIGEDCENRSWTTFSPDHMAGTKKSIRELWLFKMPTWKTLTPSRGIIYTRSLHNLQYPNTWAWHTWIN